MKINIRYHSTGDLSHAYSRRLDIDLPINHILDVWTHADFIKKLQDAEVEKKDIDSITII